MLSYVELEQIVKSYNRPLVWHFEENCKTRKLRIWKPRKDLNTVIPLSIELLIWLNRASVNWFILWLYLSMYDIVYICMAYCRGHDRIPSMFRLYLLSIVAHPFPSFPVYICRSPVASRVGPTSFDVQQSIGLRKYLGCTFRLLWSVIPLVPLSSHVVYLLLYLDCK